MREQDVIAMKCPPYTPNNRSSLQLSDCPSFHLPSCPSVPLHDDPSHTPLSCPSVDLPDCTSSLPLSCPSVALPDCISSPPPSCSSVHLPDCPLDSSQSCPFVPLHDYPSHPASSCPSVPLSDCPSNPPLSCPPVAQHDCPSNPPLSCPSVSLSDYPLNPPLSCPSVARADCLSSTPSSCSSFPLPDCHLDSSHRFPFVPPHDYPLHPPSNCPSVSLPDSLPCPLYNCSPLSSTDHYFFAEPDFPSTQSNFFYESPPNLPSNIPQETFCPPLSTPGLSSVPYKDYLFSSPPIVPSASHISTPSDSSSNLSSTTFPFHSSSPCICPISNCSLPPVNNSYLTSRATPSPPPNGHHVHFSLDLPTLEPSTTYSSGVPPWPSPTVEEALGCKVHILSVEKQLQMQQDRELADEFLDSLSRLEDWLQGAQITASMPNFTHSRHSEAKLALQRYEVLLRDMREKLLDLESLNRQYWRLSQVPHQMLLPSVLRRRMQDVNDCWDLLQREAEARHQALKFKVQQREEFEMDKEEMRLWLSEMDMGLSSVEYIYSGNPTEKINQLQAFQDHVRNNMERLEGLFQQGDLLMDISDPEDAKVLEEEMTDLGCYCQDIFTRLSRFQKRLLSSKLVYEDDLVLDDKLEVMSDGSSDVFLEMDNEEEALCAPSDGSGLPPNVSKAPTGAVKLDLEWDPLGDVGGSSSNDGQESFYTATSAQWKVVHREGSRTSISSTAWTSGSRAETQADVEHLKIPSMDPSLKMANNGQREDPALLEQIQGPDSLELEETSGPEDTHVGQTQEANCTPDPMESKNTAHNTIPEHRVISGIPDQMQPMASVPQDIDRWLKQSRAAQRRRPRRTNKGKLSQDFNKNQQGHPQEVSILIEKGSDTTHNNTEETCGRSLDSLKVWLKRFASLSLVVLFLGGSFLLFPLSRPSCTSQRFAWSLMLTYVNGPPPT
ncbi:uncharacterized protein LOC128666816 [Bombina bombina]|uniref:uncharacterized protein LOC128666816 n=1 Tax=Bombina bombina TaxID=8345 RepID=UPI00235B2F55|nr:uncharacterized protein LOC128666816 [Bombina bombina]